MKIKLSQPTRALSAHNRHREGKCLIPVTFSLPYKIKEIPNSNPHQPAILTQLRERKKLRNTCEVHRPVQRHRLPKKTES